MVLNRGQVAASIRFLAKRWQWSQRNVRTFLERMKKKEFITVDDTQGQNVISVCRFVDFDPYSDAHSQNYMDENAKTDTLISHTLRQTIDTNIKNEEERNKRKLKEKYSLREFNKERDAEPTYLITPTEFKNLHKNFNLRFKGYLNPIQRMTEKRKMAVNECVKQFGKQAVQTVFENVKNSKYLLGLGSDGWKCDFDWIFNVDNFAKILEGKYNGTIPAKNDLNKKMKNLQRKMANFKRGVYDQLRNSRRQYEQVMDVLETKEKNVPAAETAADTHPVNENKLTYFPPIECKEWWQT